MKSILLIDDDQELTKILAMRLNKMYSVDTADGGRPGYALARSNNYDVVVLDLDMPDITGEEVCRDLRSHGVLTPILVLSGKTTKLDIVQLLQLGADDYLTKPFSGDELIARLEALIRRNKRGFSSQRLEISGVVLDIDESCIKYQDKFEKLTKTEVVLLQSLMQNSPNIVSRTQLIEKVWGNYDTSNKLDVYIKRLRKKLVQIGAPPLIQTAHGHGYSFSK